MRRIAPIDEERNDPMKDAYEWIGQLPTKFTPTAVPSHPIHHFTQLDTGSRRHLPKLIEIGPLRGPCREPRRTMGGEDFGRSSRRLGQIRIPSEGMLR